MTEYFNSVKNLVDYLNLEIDKFLLFASNVNTVELLNKQIKTRGFFPFEFYYSSTGLISNCGILGFMKTTVSSDNIEINERNNSIYISHREYFELENVINYEKNKYMFLTEHEYNGRSFFLASIPRRNMIEYFIKHLRLKPIYMSFNDIVINNLLQLSGYNISINQQGNDFNFKFKTIRITTYEGLGIELQDINHIISNIYDIETAKKILVKKINKLNEIELHIGFTSSICLKLFTYKTYEKLHISHINENKSKLCIHLRTLFEELYKNTLSFIVYENRPNECIFVVKYESDSKDLLLLKFVLHW